MAKGKAKVNFLGKEGIIQSSDGPDWDFLYSASTVKDPNYNLGDRVCLPDGRAFRYAKAGADLEQMKRGVKFHNILVTEKAAICSAASIGDKSVTVTFDGDFWDTALAEDDLRGGYISFYRGDDRQQRGIIGNTAVAATGGACVIYLDAALKVALNASDNVEVIGNPYRDVRHQNEAYTSIAGMPNVLATSGQYFWIQTWGICRVTPSGAELGTTGGERQFVFDNAGSVTSHLTSVDSLSYQHAGFLVEATDGLTAGSAAPFINLQINP
jgi:hypothetical protein